MVDRGRKDIYRETWAVLYLAVPTADAELALAQRDYERATVVTDDLLARLRRYGMRSALPEALYLKAKALAGLGQQEAARDCFRTARDEAEQMGARRLLWRILNALSQMEEHRPRAKRLRQRAREIVETIAGQIEQDELRTTYLKQPDVRAVLEAVDTIEAIGSPIGGREP